MKMQAYEKNRPQRSGSFQEKQWIVDVYVSYAKRPMA